MEIEETGGKKKYSPPMTRRRLHKLSEIKEMQ